MNYYPSLICDNYYHIVQRAVGNELLFRTPENYQFFLQRYHKYISPIADTYAYCLLPNHFHFISRLKKQEDLLPLFLNVKPGNTEYEGWDHDFALQQWSNLLNSYVKAFNKKYLRKGALFMDYLRRVPIADDDQFGATVFYVHKNAVHHGLCKQIEEWRWSSYPAMLSQAPTILKREELLEWFGGIEKFIDYHQQPIYPKNAIVVE